MLTAHRMQALPPYIFAKIDQEVRALERQGRSVIDLGISDPNQPPRNSVTRALSEASTTPASHRYPPIRGAEALRRQIADWYRRRFQVDLDPDREVLVTLGSKEALVHLSLAVVDRDGVVLVPDPGYPAYFMPHALFGFDQATVPLTRRHGFLPVVSTVHAGDLERAQLMYVNYPNNPTGAVASREFWNDLVREARRWDFVICSDLAYADLIYEGRAVSVLEIPEARAVSVESITFSKSYNMQGFRLAAMVGSEEILDALWRVESQINSGVYSAIQSAGVRAMLDGPDPEVLESYRERRQLLGQGLAELGLEFEWPRGAVYFWVKIPSGWPESETYAKRLLQEAGVAVTPGTAFGPSGADYIRVSYTRPLNDLTQALRKWKILSQHTALDRK